MSDCSKCQRTDVKCCYTCQKDADKCGVWHNCGSDCPEHESRVITNADKIRAMSDAELAKFISSLVRNADDYLTSEGNWLIWLQSEAE